MADPGEDFMVYDTITMNLVRSETGQKIIQCVEDGSEFHFKKKLGRGAFSKVYLAERVWRTEAGEEMRKDFAIKCMHKTLLKKQRCATYDEDNNMIMMNNLEKVYKEVEIWRILCNENLVRLYEVVNDPSHEWLYLIIEKCEYGDLMKWGKTEGHYLPNQKIIDRLKELHPEKFVGSNDLENSGKIIFEQMLFALEYLQKPTKRVVHRDIKPDNILYAPADDKVKMTDFTVSKRLTTLESPIYDTGGTIAFQAPETMISGNGYQGPPSDIWSLGVTIYVWCSGGKMPFWNPESELETQLQIKDKTPEWPAEFSEQLINLLSNMLNKDWEARPKIIDLYVDDWFI